MADYRETSVTGTKYRRASGGQFSNPIGGVPSISFWEEDVINIADGRMTQNIGNLSASMDVDMVNVSVALRDPATSEETGQSMTIGQIYAALYSLYWHMATERDNNG